MAAKEPPVLDIKEYLREKKLPKLLSPNLPSYLLTKYNIQGIDINSLQRGGSSSPIGSNSPSTDIVSPTRHNNNNPRYHQPYIHRDNNRTENENLSKSRYEIKGKSVIVKLKVKNDKYMGLGISMNKSSGGNNVSKNQLTKEEEIFKAKKIHWVNLARDKKHEAENERYEGKNKNKDKNNYNNDYWIMTYLESIFLFLIGFQYEQNLEVKLVNFKDLVPLITFVINLLEKEKEKEDNDNDKSKVKDKDKDKYSCLIGLLSLVSLITLTKIKEISIKNKEIELNHLTKIENQLKKFQNSIDRYLHLDLIKTKFPNVYSLRSISINQLNLKVSQRPLIKTKNLFYLPFNNLNMEVNNLIQFGMNLLVEWSEFYKTNYKFSYDGSNHSK